MKKDEILSLSTLDGRHVLLGQELLLFQIEKENRDVIILRF